MATANQVGATTFTTPSDREIVTTRVVDAPRRLVVAAWTNPEHLPHWMVGMGIAGADRLAPEDPWAASGRGRARGRRYGYFFWIKASSRARSGASRALTFSALTSATMMWPTSSWTSLKRPCVFIFWAW